MRKSRSVIYLYIFFIMVPICILLKLKISESLSLVTLGVSTLAFFLLIYPLVLWFFEYGREKGIKEMAKKLNKDPEDYYDKDDKEFTLTSVMKDNE